MDTTGLPLVDRLRQDLKAAMKAKQMRKVTTLRTMLSALDNATAVEVDTSFVPLYGVTPDVPRKELSEADQVEILQREAAQRLQALKQYEALGKLVEAARVRQELDVFASYLEVPSE